MRNEKIRGWEERMSDVAEMMKTGEERR